MNEPCPQCQHPMSQHDEEGCMHCSHDARLTVGQALLIQEAIRRGDTDEQILTATGGRSADVCFVRNVIGALQVAAHN